MKWIFCARSFCLPHKQCPVSLVVILFISQYIRVKCLVTPDECLAKLMSPEMIKHTPASQQIHSYKLLCPLLKHSINQVHWGWTVCRHYRGQEVRNGKSNLHACTTPLSDVSTPPFCSWYEPRSTEKSLLIDGSRCFKMASSNTVSRCSFLELQNYWHQWWTVKRGIYISVIQQTWNIEALKK